MTERALAAARHPAFVVWLVAFHVTFGVLAVASPTELHDEGLLTWLYASYLGHDFLPAFFFLKAKPALALLNLPGTLLGMQAFFVVHVLIGAAGIVLVWRAALALGLREAWLPPLIVAASPLYLLGSPLGISDVDGVAAGAAAIWLCARRPPALAAGLVIGALPLVRFELAVLSAALGIAALVPPDGRRRARFVAGALAIPLLYLAAGAVYHRDAAWVLHFPPAAGHVDEATYGVIVSYLRDLGAGQVLAGLAFVTPALPLLLGARWRALGAVERAVAAAVLATVAALAILPFARLMVTYSERYFLVALPGAALLAARSLESGRAFPVLLVTAAAVGLALVRAPGAAVALAGATGAAAVAFAARARPAAGLFAAGTLLLAWPLVSPDTSELARDRTGAAAQAAALLDAHPELAGAPVYTNLKVLDAHLLRRGSPREVRCLLHDDNLAELLGWSNPANGQREALLALARWRFYGIGATVADLGDAPGAALIIQRDPRLGAWDAPATLLEERGDLLLYRLR
jgi:hypothetical protein